MWTSKSLACATAVLMSTALSSPAQVGGSRATEGHTARAVRRAPVLYQPDFARASELLGQDIVDATGKDVGTLDDLAVDAGHGLVAYAIVARGGVIGLGEKLTAIPFKSLSRTAGEDRLRLSASAAILDHVPEYSEDHSDLENTEQASELFSQFSVQPYWQSSHRDAERTEPARQRGARGDEDFYGYQGSERDAPDTLRRRPTRDGWPSRNGGASPDDAYGEGVWPMMDNRRPAARRQAGSVDYPQQPPREYRSQRGSRGQTEQGGWYDEDRPERYQAREREAAADQSLWGRQRHGELGPGRTVRGTPAREPRWFSASGRTGPGAIVRVSDLLDEDLEGSNADSIGEIEDLMVDVSTGGVGYAVISEEAFLGSDTLHAVPWTAIQLQRQDGTPMLVLNMSENELERSPSFDDDNWPDMADTGWIARVHEFYGVQPSWTYYGYVDTGSQEPQIRFDPQSMRTVEGTVEAMSRHGRLDQRRNVLRLRLAVSGEPAEQQASGQAATRPATAGSATQPSDAGQASREQTEATAGQREQSIVVYLSPVGHLRDEGLAFRRGDEVTVQGSEVTMDGRPAILASQLTKDGKTIRLRDEQGRPLWTQVRRDSQAMDTEQAEPAQQQ